MSQRRFGLLAACGLCAALASSHAPAGVIEFDDRGEWEAAAGAFATIGFGELPHGTWVFEQYAHLGVHFVDPCNIVIHDPLTFLIDGAGLNGLTEIHLIFDAPMTSIASDFPGSVVFELRYQGAPVYTSSLFGPAGGLGNFGGLVSTEPFDEVIITDPGSYVNLDDLHFGPPIPAPPVLALLALAAARTLRRGRTR